MLQLAACFSHSIFLEGALSQLVPNTSNASDQRIWIIKLKAQQKPCNRRCMILRRAQNSVECARRQMVYQDLILYEIAVPT